MESEIRRGTAGCAHDPKKYRRKSVRLKQYDYSHAGGYFITICTYNKECLFGEVINGEMRITEYGNIVRDEWLKAEKLREYVKLDRYVVMPNHFHGIIIIYNDNEGTARCAPTSRFGKIVPNSLPVIVRSFKSAVTKQINMVRKEYGKPVWQRNYYEHVIRNDEDLQQIREYVDNNPLKWELDKENPQNRLKKRTGAFRLS